MSPLGKKSNWLLLSTVASIILLVFAWRRAHRQADTITSRNFPPTTQPKAASEPHAPAAPALAQRSVSPAPELSVLIDALKSGGNGAAGRQLLANLRQELARMPTNAAISAIRQFLDSKADAPTHLGFKVARNGQLDEAPTVRTFLLDELGRLDPVAAAEYSKAILTSMDSPDEWAVSLRNLAWGDTSDQGRALLEQKINEMLRRESWQQSPSIGFLEAFDVVVYAGDTTLMPALTDLLQQKDNPAVAHASYLALDRLVINNPTAALTAFLANPDSMQGREATRANYFARADVSDPQQLQILESYLLNPKISAKEIDAFAGIFPNANYMISANLLTQSQTPDRTALVNRDATSLRIVQQWLADPRFASLRPTLGRLDVRLAGFVQQENSRQ